MIALERMCTSPRGSGRLEVYERRACKGGAEIVRGFAGFRARIWPPQKEGCDILLTVF
jgi:hypothetical protein